MSLISSQAQLKSGLIVFLVLNPESVSWWLNLSKTEYLSNSLLVWFLGMGSIFSFNVWSDLKFLGLNFLELMDYLTNNIMLPVGGFFISIFVGWVLPNSLVQKYVKLNDQLFKIFIFFLKYVSTGAIALIFLYSVL